MRSVLLCLSVAALAACGDLQHESPYDPKAPPDTQARTAFSGTISLEAVAGSVPTLAGIAVSVAGRGYAATTDATGHFRIEGVPPGTYTIQAVLSGYETTSVAGVTATLDTGGTTVAVPALSMRRVRADLAGRIDLRLPNDVLEATGGASVSIDPAAPVSVAGAAALAVAAASTSVATALTDDQGAFVIPGVPAPLGSYTLTASKHGFLTQTSTVTFQDGAFVVQTVQLAIDPGAIVGSLRVAGASSAFGVTVRARGTTLGGTPWEDVTTSDALGAFRLSGLPAGTYSVSYERADLLTVATSAHAVEPGLDTVLAPVELSPATGGLDGTVLLASATSAAGVVVTASGPVVRSTVTDATGAFTLAGLPVGTYAVTARKDPEWQEQTQTGLVVVRDVTATLPVSPITLQAVASATLSGVAHLEGATDHALVTATLSGTDFRGVAVPAATTFTTGTSGAWAFGNLPAGSYQVSLARTGFDEPPALGASLVTAQTVTFGTVTLAASRGSAGGTVIPSGAASRAGTVVELAGGPDTATAITDTAGAWRVDGLRVGAGYTATYRRTGYVTPLPSSFAITSGTTTPVGTVTLQIAATGTISGVASVARPADPGSSAGIHVALTGTDLNGAAVTGGADTVSGGRYDLVGLPQGTYALTFSKLYYDPTSRSGIALTDGGTATPAPVTLQVATGTLAGQVFLSAGTATGFAQGTDYSGTLVSLTGLEAGLSVPVAVTDAAGNFRFDGVPVHTAHLAYGVVAQHPGYLAGNASVTAEPAATATAIPSPLTLEVAAGSVEATVVIDDLGGATVPPSNEVTLTLTGSAFNSTAFGASADNVGGGFTLSGVPPGTYDVAASSPGRRCSAGRSITVSPSEAVVLTPAFVCTDAVAPGSVALGVPQGTNAEPGFTSSTAVAIPILADATDLTGNLLGYQYAVGAVPDWDTAPVTTGLVSPIPLPVGSLPSDGTWTLWVRAVDWVRNAGPASSVEVVRDTGLPAAVSIQTARAVVNATSTSAILTGGADPNFRSYRSCTALVSATAPCGACPLEDSAASIPVTFDAPDRKACVWALAVDRAGNTSATADLVEIVSDLTPPTGPIIGPLYDPASVTVHADFVDFVVSPATDLPRGGGEGWRDIAWVEADTGAGFEPLCPAAACREGGLYAPCTCGCTDPRLICNGATFWAIRLPLNSGAANRIAVRAVDLAGNVGSGASQEVLTSGILTAIATTGAQEDSPRTRGRTLLYRSDSQRRIVDLGDDLRFDATDPTCAVTVVYPEELSTYEYAAALLDSDTLLFSTGERLKVRRRTAATWCPDFAETTVATRSGAGWTIDAVAAGLDASGRLERVVYAENTFSPGFVTRVWSQEGGSTGHVDDLDAPDPVEIYSIAGSLTTRLDLGGDALLVRTATSQRSIWDGTYQVLHRPPGGWGSAPPVTLPLDDWAIRSAALDASGARLAWSTISPSQTTLQLSVATPGADGVFGPDDVAGAATRSFAVTSGALSNDLALEGGHLVMTEFIPRPTSHLTHWAAGPDGRFGTPDDTFARMMPTSSYRMLVALGTGLGGGVVYLSQSQGSNNDLFAVDLSAFRWDALSNNAGALYPKSNHSGTYFFARQDGVWARAPDGGETTGGVAGAFYEADGDVFASHVGADVVVHWADPSGRFFTPAAPPWATFLAGRSGHGAYGGSLAIAVGDGRVVAGTCESKDAGGSCIEHSVALLEPDPLLTLSEIRLDRPADGAPASTSVANGGAAGVGVNARHLIYSCDDASPPAIGDAICVREPGPNGRYDAGVSDDVSFVLRGPSGTRYSGTGGPKMDGDRIVFFRGSAVVVVEAPPGGSFADWTTLRETTVGTTTQAQPWFYAIAGDYVAWMTSGNNGPQPWVADVRHGTSRQVSSHYSYKYGLTVERTGRVLWEDSIFSTRAVFLSAP